MIIDGDFADWLLHDGTLRAFFVDWKGRTCRAELSVWFERARAVEHCELVWSGVRHVELPIRHPWGPSSAINTQCVDPDGRFCIEMQSGDTIVVEAESVTLQRNVAESR